MQAGAPDKPLSPEWDQPLSAGPGTDRGAATGPPTANLITVSAYRVPPAYTWIQVGFALGLMLWIVADELAMPSTPDNPLPFRLFFAAAVATLGGFAVYQKLFRDARLLELSEVELRWYAPLRRGRVRLTDLREITRYGSFTVSTTPIVTLQDHGRRTLRRRRRPGRLRGVRRGRAPRRSGGAAALEAGRTGDPARLLRRRVPQVRPPADLSSRRTPHAIRSAAGQRLHHWSWHITDLQTAFRVVQVVAASTLQSI